MVRSSRQSGFGGNKGREDDTGTICGIRSAPESNKPLEEGGGGEHDKSVCDRDSCKKESK
ncbi:TPA: hypothetical protein DCW38_06625 [candidate division WOR-3 bacterium]|uniref:Uncharacterized protein n=1 Tax=candidate division WOR-3 bacterium TaxID=2052148 RepID=A0A350HBC2_UNCW3|nr:hypothetical protein [candidate division WOR-3 bacterium]